jgi:Fic family protein
MVVAIDDAAADDDALDVDTLCGWHRLLMAGSPTPERYVGRIRDEQGWIGGTSPFDAHLVTPPADRLRPMLDDLLAWVNRDDVDPIAQAAIAHAQFEIIHPFADGNGRIGRVLIAWILVRRLALLVPPPVSVAIAADVGGYAAGLVRFRLDDHLGWVRWFADVVSGGGRAQRELVAHVDELRGEWHARLTATGLRRDAVAYRALTLLPRHLLLTSTVLVDELGVSTKAALDALRALADAGVLTEHGTAPSVSRGQPARLYVARELLGLAGATSSRA